MRDTIAAVMGLPASSQLSTPEDHMTRGLLTAVLVATLAVPAASLAQGPPGQRQQGGMQQQDRMQQHIQQMDEQLRRMDRIRDRLHQFDEDCLNQMQRTQDQDRLHEQQRLHEMAQAMDGAAHEMKQNLERTREMARNQLFQKDPELQQELTRLREHWRDMLGKMEEGVGVMERIQKRLHTPD
jgi:hypothetical protein